jgi:pimeloyl-ACP methyl ester carboxylesterase
MNHARPLFSDAPPLPAWLESAFPFQRRMFAGGRFKIHFVDHGSGPPVLLQHGNPTWSFLWRKVMQRLVAEGFRVVAPDMVGLGLSDKPRDPGMHSLRFHAIQIGCLVSALALPPFIVVGQDWGGPIMGLVAADRPQQVAGAVFANTGLVAPRRRRRLSPFHRLARFPVISSLLFRGLGFPLMALDRVQGARSSIGPLEKRAYRWPLRRWRDRTAPLALARMFANGPRHPSALSLARAEAWARGFRGPVQLVWGRRDPILGRALGSLARLFPHASITETAAGHFLQEEVPDVLACAIRDVARHV